MNTAWSRFRDWLQRQLLQPFSNGISGFATAFTVFFGTSLLMLFPMGVGEHLADMTQINGSAGGLEALARSTGLYQLSEMLANATSFSILEVSLVLLSAAAALVMTFCMAFVGWMWITTITTVAFTGRALNGQSLSKRKSIILALNSGVLLVLLLVLYGTKIWLFALWEVLLLCGVMAVAWRLRYPAKREFFGPNARGELKAAWHAGKSLGVVFLVVLGLMLSQHAKISALPGQWMLIFILVPSALFLWFFLVIEEHVKKAVSIARHDRNVYQIRNRDT